jgi:hypothetical protein
MRVAATVISSVLLGAWSFAPAIADSGKLPPDRAPSLMTPTEIRAYNDGLDPTHPYYIKCKKDPVVGSLVRKLRVCRTNEEWKKSLAMGDDNGREILDDMRKAPSSGNSPAFDTCPNNRC